MPRYLNNLILSLCLFGLNILLLPRTALAQGKLLQEAQQASGLSDQNIESLVGTIINSVLGLLGTVFLVLIIYGGFLWMTAGGNEEQVGKAKKVITSSVIGLLIVTLSYAITQFVFKQLISAGL